MKIFLVEDSSLVRQRLIEALSVMENMEIIGHAETEEDALLELSRVGADVAILDIQLKRGSGMNVLLKTRAKDARLRIIILTNFSYSQYREKCLACGADHFFDKTTEFMKVSEVLRQWSAAGAGKREQIQ